jgi:hypothetical protein
VSTDASEQKRFDMLRQLGAGGCGVVYEAIDRAREERVALKTLTRLDPGALFRFKKEFRALADVAHPNLVQLYELVCEKEDDKESWFFTMELVSGVDFIGWVRPATTMPTIDTLDTSVPELGSMANIASSGSHSMGSIGSMPITARAPSTKAPSTPRRLPALGTHATQPLLPDLHRLRSALGQLAGGLAALHAAGKLHRDVKPSNVLVDASGRVVLVDFGIVTDLGEQASGVTDGGALTGTPAYMAPEQGAGQPLTAAADWYAVGVLMFEALTGRLPFLGEPIRVLMDKQQFEPPRPRELVPAIPEDLDHLCAMLLRRAPEARPTGDEVLRRLGVQGNTTAAPPTTFHTVVPPFVGREAALAELHDAYESVHRGRAETVFVRGPSGMGKSSLVRRFLDEIASREKMVVLAGRCFERESVPYKAFDGVIDALSVWLRKMPRAQVEALLPRDPYVLARVFPVLERVPAIGEAPRRTGAVDPRQLRSRAFGALRDLLARIADRQPVVIFIDDLQWGDVDSASLLVDLTSPPDPPTMLTVLGYRSEDTERSVTLQTLQKAWQSTPLQAEPRDISIEALSHEEATRLATMMLGSSPGVEAMARTIAEESHGSPFFLGELVRYVQTDAARVSSTGLRLERVVRDRVKELPAGALRLLEVIAVASRPLPPEVAHRAADLPADERAEALWTLRAAHLVKSGGTAGRVTTEPYHDRIRETVVGMLGPKPLRERHASIARALRESGEVDPEALFVHLRGAEHREQAAEYAQAAAEKATRALAFERAAQFYGAAIELLPKGDASIRTLNVSMGDALSNSGRGRGAAKAYLAATDGASESDQLELRRRAAEQLLRSGHVDEGIDALRDVLAHVGMRLAPTTTRALISLVLMRIWLWIRGLRFKVRDATAVSPRDLTQIDICWSIGAGLGVVDNIRAAEFQTRGLLLCLRAGEPRRLARALAFEATFMATAGPKSAPRTEKLAALAADLAKKTGAADAKAHAAIARAAIDYFSGQWKRARNDLETTEPILREQAVGLWWELVTLQYFGLCAVLYLGDLPELSKRLHAYLRDAEDRGDFYLVTNLRVGETALYWLLLGEAKIARERVATTMKRWSRRGFQIQHWYEMQALCHIDLYEGQGAVALDRVTSGWNDLDSSLIFRVQHTLVRAHWLRGRCALAAIAEGRPSIEMLALARRASKKLRKQKLHWATPLAALLDAAIAVQGGDREAATRHLEESVRMFDHAEMALYAAVARHRLGSALGGDKGAAMTKEAAHWMTSRGVRDPERVCATLAPGFESPRVASQRRPEHHE